MAGLVDRAKSEVVEVVAVTSYFLAAFATIGLVTKLFLLEFGVEIAGVGKVVVAALVVGKVVVVLDKTNIGERFQSRAVWKTVLYRALIYTVFVAVVLFFEKVFHGYREAGTLSGGLDHALDHAHFSRGMATSICVFVTFVGYGLFAELKRTVGRDRLVRFLFEDGGRQAPEPPIDTPGT
jgi:hypothetical protein